MAVFYQNPGQPSSIQQSMSRRANCWENAVMERLFRSLKPERLNSLTFINHLAAATQVESYIQFYNYKRLHSTIDYMTPHQKYQNMKKWLRISTDLVDHYTPCRY